MIVGIKFYQAGEIAKIKKSIIVKWRSFFYNIKDVIFLKMSFLIRNCQILSLSEKRRFYLPERIAFSRDFVWVQQFEFA